MEFIEDLLINLKEIEPVYTGVEPDYKRDASIKAIVFDIYGTLLVSASGDIEQALMSENILKEALESANITLNTEDENALKHILDDFEYTIQVCHQSSRNNDIPYPEIDILTIWEIVLLHARRKNLVSFGDDMDTMRMTCVFEFMSNRVYPMPNMKEVINKLWDKKIPLGIVSNAQFYTPVVMNYFLHQNYTLNEFIEGFQKDLSVFSYKLGKGKPDTYLFNELIDPLKKSYGLRPDEVLFVGNDMLKDIYTSKQLGFKTVLFAGDQRSLRWRKEDRRVNGLKPDHVITDLTQLLEIVS